MLEILLRSEALRETRLRYRPPGCQSDKVQLDPRPTNTTQASVKVGPSQLSRYTPSTAPRAAQLGVNSSIPEPFGV